MKWRSDRGQTESCRVFGELVSEIDPHGILFFLSFLRLCYPTFSLVLSVILELGRIQRQGYGLANTDLLCIACSMDLTVC